eukprot:gene7816-8662_t
MFPSDSEVSNFSASYLSRIESKTSQDGWQRILSYERMDAETVPTSQGIKQECMKCNVIASRLRGKINDFMFDLGCWIQAKSLAIFLIGITILFGLCVGLKKTNMETNIEKLWVEDGGRLSKELKFLDSFSENGGINSDTEVLIQVNKEKNDNILTVQSLEEHLEIMKKIALMQIYVHQDMWRLSDLCQKPSFGTVGGGILDKMLEQMTPCMVITPLDCFYEGSQIAGPAEPAFIPMLKRSESWETLDPYGLIDELVRANKTTIPEVELKKLFKKAGIDKGYLTKPCLNPQSSKCPKESPNYGSNQAPDIGKEMSGGCTGYASKLMNWPEELLVGGRRRNKNQLLRSGEALQSVLYLLSSDDVYSAHKDGKGLSIPNWSRQKAEEVIKAWQRKFTKIVNQNGYNNASMKTNVMAYSSTSFYDLIKNFSQPNITKVITGYLVMLAYAFITLKRWSNAVYSYGAVGVVGVILVSASVASALGLSSLLKVSFNAASTQVLPFLALGLGVDDMFLLARTYVTVCESKDFEEHEVVGETLRNSGLSITLTSFTNACAFAMASLVPIPALQAFSRQASLIVILNWMTMIFLFSSTLAFDVKRVQAQKYDLFCCSGRHVETLTPTSLNSGNILQDIAFINLDRLQNGQSIYAGASLNALLGAHATNLDASASIGGRNGALRNSRRKPPASNVATQQSRSPPQQATQTTPGSSQDQSDKSTATSKWEYFAQRLSMTYFAEKHFAPFLQYMITKIAVIFMLAIFLGICAYGAIQVKDGLDVAEMVPKASAEHAFVTSRFSYFSFYQMHAVTKGGFDYANNQKLLYSFHNSFKKFDEVIVDADGNLPKFWLIYFRDWLSELQHAFDAEWKEGRLSERGWSPTASKEAILGFKLIVLTGNPSRQQDFQRLSYARLVDNNGIINTKLFYYYLTAWYNEDTIGYWISQAGLKPSPPFWYNFHGQRFPANSSVHVVPKAQPISMALMPFYLNNIKTTEDFVRIIKTVREQCSSFADKGLPNFPTGIPFTYWEQYVYLHGYLWMAVGVVLAATLIVLTLCLMNLWAALILVAVLVMNTFELYGVMGLMSLKLSAVPAVTLIISVGVAVEFTVHICLAFLSSEGDRNERMHKALVKMFAPVLDGAFSTLIGVIVLAGAEFEFVVRYFFQMILAMIVIGLANGLILLPVLLSFIGPCCEVTHRSVLPSQTGPRANRDGNVLESRAASSNRSSSRDFELTDFGFNPELSTRTSPRGGRSHSRGRQKPSRTSSGNDDVNRNAFRNPFGRVAGTKSRYCRYQHRNCVYDHRLRKCREQLTPVAEVSTPDSSCSSSGKLSVCSKSSRPGTPMGVPGRPVRVPSAEFSKNYPDDSDDCDEDLSGLPGYVEDQAPGYTQDSDGVTTLKATATVTLELTSSSASKPFRIVRLQQSK